MIHPPALTRIRQRFDRPTLGDPASAVAEQLARPEIRATLEDKARIAVAVGSRGIAGIAGIVAAVVAGIRDAGSDPFVVPAMGSHGGATAEGQRAVLAHLGITEESVGAPIRSSMEVVEIGEVTSPHGHRFAVVTDAVAWGEADGIVPVNRVKPHTGFRGPIESGICKMLAIGLAKHEGAARMHSEGYPVFDRLVVDAARVTLATGKVAFGVAVVENAYEETALIEAIAGGAVVEREPELLDRARRLMPGLPFPAIDVLVVERFGKNISGVGMDPNITGRGEMGGPLPGFEGPAIARIVVLGLTPETGGNAHGIGLADVITRDVWEQIDRDATWTNTLTAGTLACGRIPIALPTADEAVAAAVSSVWGRRAEEARIVRIRDTLHLTEFAVSEPLLGDVAADARCEVAGAWDGVWHEA